MNGIGQESKNCLAVNKQCGALRININELFDTVSRYERIVTDIEDKIFVPQPQPDCLGEKLPETEIVSHKLSEIQQKIECNNDRLDYILKCLISQFGDDLKLQ